MRVRRFELRLIGGALVAAWSVAAALVLVAYRPGGPLDVLVGITMLAPIVIGVASVISPPVARGANAFPAMVALGLGSLLVLVPSIGGVLNQILAFGSQTLMPSIEAAYPWVLALVGTSLFSAFGLVRRWPTAAAIRRQRLTLGVALAVGLTLFSGGLFAAVAIANELVLQRSASTAISSRFGPVRSGEPAACDGGLSTGTTARLRSTLSGAVDRRPIGSVELRGLRSGRDFRWLAYVATGRELGEFGAARQAERAWTRTPRSGWRDASQAEVGSASVDVQAARIALTAGYRATAEDRGMELVEGARARRCRVAIDGDTFRRAFPQVEWLVGTADLGRWRGQLDYWIFLDGDLGQLAGSVNGEASGIQSDALQATVEVLLTATERGREMVVYPPAP